MMANYKRCPECGQIEGHCMNLCSRYDAALRKGAAERAMLDEILALPDIEAPTGDGSENVAAVVASALEALREERDAAIARADRLYQDRYDLLNVTTKEGLLASEWVMRTAKAERERDEAVRLRDRASDLAGKYEADRGEVRDRADRAESLLRECQQYMGGLGLGRRGQELLAKIREALR